MSDPLKLFIDNVIKQNINVRTKVPGSELTTYRIGGDIAYLVSLSSESDIEIFSELIKNQPGIFDSANVTTIGKGSNVIVDDEGFNGVVIVLNGQMSVFEDRGQSSGLVTALGGTALPVLARQACSLGLGGLEFYVGIPGTVGGAVAMNAGGHGKQTSDVLVSTQVLDLSTGDMKTFTNEQCNFSYRHSTFSSTDLVVSANYSVVEQDPSALKIKLDEIVSWRRENQPGGRNVGSVFQNPSDVSAGSLIEYCGLKGFRIGGAFVSEKHANFIQADIEATSNDVKELISHVQKTVYEATGNKLETEVRYIGTSNG